MSNDKWAELERVAAKEGFRVLPGSRKDTILVAPDCGIVRTAQAIHQVFDLETIYSRNYWGPTYDPRLAETLESHLDSQEPQVLDVWATSPVVREQRRIARCYLNVVDESTEITLDQAYKILDAQTKALGEPGQMPDSQESW